MLIYLDKIKVLIFLYSQNRIEKKTRKYMRDHKSTITYLNRCIIAQYFQSSVLVLNQRLTLFHTIEWFA